MNHLIKRGRVRRAASKAVSVTLSTTTTLWLVGSSLFLGVPVASASNDAVVSDITSTNPRIAPSGESELAVLGVNIQMDANPNGVDKRLQSLAVQLKSDDAAGNGEAALANIETARLYSDSGLSGTGGVFDSNDALVATSTRTFAGAMTAQVAGAHVATNTWVDVDTIVNGLGDGAAASIKVGTGLTAETRTAVYETNDTAAGDACATAAGANTCFTVAALTFAHADNEVVRQIGGLLAVATLENSAASAFSVFAAAGTGDLRTGFETAVVFGDTTADADADVLTFTPPTTDAGNDAGNDLFLTFLTAGGVANQTFTASIWPDEVAGENVRIQLHDILLDNAGGGGNVAVNSNTTNNESKTITFGADNVAPTIQNVWTYDNDGDGNVDRVRVKFSESMANTVTASQNFKSAIGGTVSEIESVPASNDDIDLAANGTWQTTTVLNDTLQIDFAGDTQNADAACGETVGEYCNATASTGDTWSVVYDADLTNDLADATGTLLADATVSTTDKARPVITAAQVRDNDGDSNVDELRLTGSETWGGSSTVSGVELRRTDVNPNVIYTMGAVSGFIQSTGVAAVNGNANTSNSNDIIRLAVTEAGGEDVTGVFQVNYTAASTLTDNAANEARSITGLAAGSGATPVVQQVWLTDIGGNLDGAADANGQLDALVVIFNNNVEVDGDPTLDMALSGGYVITAAGVLDNDDDQLLVFPVTPSGVSDTDRTPDWTYTNDGLADGDGLCAAPAVVGNACLNAADILVDSVTSSAVIEQNRAGAVLLTVNMYETTADDLWQAGETLVTTFSEDILSSSVRASYTSDALLNGPSDFGWANVVAAEMPNSVNVSVSGRVVTFTAVTSGTEAWDGNETMMVNQNEIYDLANNASPGPNAPGGGVIPGFGVAAEQSLAAAIAVTLTPNVAPAVLRIDTNDANNNGILDSFIVEIGGLVSSTTVTAADFAAARGANFNANILGQAAACGGVAGDNWACATTDVTPDLTITSVTTLNGGNDSRLLVSYSEVGENTGARAQLKYVQGSLADLAGNKIATFNASASNNAKIDLTITNGAGDFPARDNVVPQVKYKLLKDRDMDSKIDQLVLVFSETILNGAATTVNGVLNANGWLVAGKSLAVNGATINNTDYQMYTFANVSNVFQIDVTEGTTADATIPGVSYTSSGQVRDTGGNVLGNVAAGGEATNITGVVPPQTYLFENGSLIRGTSTSAVWIVKNAGGKMFKRHVLFSNFDTFYPHLAPFWDNVDVVSDANVAAHSMSAWVRLDGTNPVYEINDDNTKHWITCADDSVAGQDCANEWTMSGRDFDGVYVVNSAEFNSYVTGATVIMPDQTN